MLMAMNMWNPIENISKAIIDKSDENTSINLDIIHYSIKKKQRYLNIVAKIQSIADLGSKTQSSYKKMMDSIQGIENDLLGIKTYKDAKSAKSGRPRKNRLKSIKIKCQIIEKNHLAKDCSHLEEVRSYIDFEPNKIKSKRQCIICLG